MLILNVDDDRCLPSSMNEPSTFIGDDKAAGNLLIPSVYIAYNWRSLAIITDQP